MNTHTLCFCPLIRKLQPFEILKWAQGSQWRKQRTSNIISEIQLIFSLLLIFSRLWNTAFLKYALYLINIFLYFINLYIIKMVYLATLTLHQWESWNFKMYVHFKRDLLENQNYNLFYILLYIAILYFTSIPVNLFLKMHPLTLQW